MHFCKVYKENGYVHEVSWERGEHALKYGHIGEIDMTGTKLKIESTRFELSTDELIIISNKMKELHQKFRDDHFV